MADEHKFRMPQQSVLYLLVCVVGLLAFVFLGPYASYEKTRELEARITELRGKIATQEVLHPVHDQLRSRLTAPLPTALEIPPSAPVPDPSPQRVRGNLFDVAHRTGLVPVDASFELNSFGTDKEHILVAFQATGEFENLRNFLVELAELPHLDKVLELNITHSPEGRELKTRLRLFR
ncbi:MAG: hypothetical protein ACLFOY_12335 [Desulfatibacillaceae bacterium]